MNKNIFKIALLALAILSFTNSAQAVVQPIANAGPNLYVSSSQSVTLQGSGSNPDGGSITYYWSCNGGYLSNASYAQPIYTPPYTSGQATYICTLTVTNSTGVTNSSSTTIFVNYSQTGNNNIQTNSATNIYYNQATLNGYIQNTQSANSLRVWFQWGTSTLYGSETIYQIPYNAGSFSQNITGLVSNTTYHFRAVGQINNGQIFYGQDMTFYTPNYGQVYTNNGRLSVTKSAINLTAGMLTWSSSIVAVPGDALEFAIFIQAGSNQELHNVVVTDILPANISSLGNVKVNGILTYGNTINGLNIGTIPAGQTKTITYQAKVAPSSSFVFGTTTLNNSVAISSQETGTNSTASNTTIVVSKTAVSGATTINTGLTNNIFTDSFFLPLLIILLTAYLYFSGSVYKFADWIKSKI